MLHILGAGHAHPETEITNAFLCALGMGSDPVWIERNLGIEARRTVLPLDYLRETKNQDPRLATKVAVQTPTELGVAAAQMALARAEVRAEDLGLVIANCCAPVQTTPSEAQRIAGELGVKVRAFDVFTACPAFALHLDLLASIRPERLPRYTLCVSTAALTTTVDYTDRTDSAIWGDGAAAWVVSAKDRRGLRVLETSYETDPTRSQAVVVDRQGYFRQDGKAVRHFSVAQTVRMLRALEQSHELDWKTTRFIGHQANRTMLEQICKNRQIPAANHLSNVVRFGNQAAAGAPATISQAWDAVATGGRTVVCVVGAGLSWGHALLEPA